MMFMIVYGIPYVLLVFLLSLVPKIIHLKNIYINLIFFFKIMSKLVLKIVVNDYGFNFKNYNFNLKYFKIVVSNYGFKL